MVPSRRGTVKPCTGKIVREWAWDRPRALTRTFQILLQTISAFRVLLHFRPVWQLFRSWSWFFRKGIIRWHVTLRCSLYLTWFVPITYSNASNLTQWSPKQRLAAQHLRLIHTTTWFTYYLDAKIDFTCWVCTLFPCTFRYVIRLRCPILNVIAHGHPIYHTSDKSHTVESANCKWRRYHKSPRFTLWGP